MSISRSGQGLITLNFLARLRPIGTCLLSRHDSKLFMWWSIFIIFWISIRNAQKIALNGDAVGISISASDSIISEMSLVIFSVFSSELLSKIALV